MQIINGLKELEVEHYVLVVVCFMAMFSPGLLILAIYFPDQFMAMTSLKLVLISFAIGLPLAVPHIIGAGCCLCSAANHPTTEKLKYVPVLGTIVGAVCATCVSYFCIVVAFLIGLNIKPLVLLMIASEVASCMFWIWALKSTVNRRNAPNNSIQPNAKASAD